MTKYIKKHKEEIVIVFIFILVFLYFLTSILMKEISNLDELWNYNIARNIAKGLIPYKDISLITTPLLPIIEAVVLKVTANELITFRVLNAVLVTSIIFITYKIFYELNKGKLASILLAMPFIWILKDDLFLDYNFFTVFLTLLITYIELKIYKDERNVKLNFIIGILGGLAFCTKQTIGIIICFEVLGMQLIKSWKTKDFMNILYRGIGIAIPIIILLIYLLITKSFSDFFSYTFLAINTFNNKIPYTSLIESNDKLIKLLSIVLPAFIIASLLFVIFYKNKEKKQYYKLRVLFICSLTLLPIQYPIADRIHFILSNYLVIVLLLFIVWLLIIKIYNKINIDFKRFILIVSKVYLTLFVITMLLLNTKSNYKQYILADRNTELKYYKKLIVPEYTAKLYNDIKSIEEQYESQGKKVNILDSNAVAIHIPMDKYIKNYDMFNKGNLGNKGEKGIIKEIEESQNQVYLIKKDDYSKNWQNPNEITDYVKNNLQKIGEIDIYNIYEKDN